MVTTGKPQQTREQRLEHLAEANRVRSSKAALKRDLAAQRLSFAEAIADERSRRCQVLELLQATPRIGKIKAPLICRSANVPTTRRIENLSSADRLALLKIIPA